MVRLAPTSREGFCRVTVAVVALGLVHLPAFAQRPLATAGHKLNCSDLTTLNEAVWSANGIERRQALEVLGGCGSDAWRLKVLMAPLPELDDDAFEAWINIYTGLDPQAILDPARITDFLVDRSSSSDPEERRLALYGLRRLLNRPFSISQFAKSRQAFLRGLTDEYAGVREIAAEAFIGALADMPADHELFRPVVSALVSRTTDPTPAVRAASLRSIGYLSEPPHSLISSEQLLRTLEPRLSDASAIVRLQAVNALPTNSREEQPPAMVMKNAQRLQLLIKDTDLDVAIAAVNRLTETELPKLISLIQSGHLSTHLVSALLSNAVGNYGNPRTALIELSAGSALIHHLLSSSDLSVRLNAQRAFNEIQARKKTPITKTQIAKSRDLFAEGLSSDDPATQLDAIAGIVELGLNPETIALLRPHLVHTVAPVRWATGLALGSFDPDDPTIRPVLDEILQKSSDRIIRYEVSTILDKQTSHWTFHIFCSRAKKANRSLFYARDISSTDFSIPEDKATIVASRMFEPECRRAIAEGLTNMQEQGDLELLKTLINMSQAKELDLRFNAIYALGGVLARESDSKEKARLSDEITTLILPLTRNKQEHPEIRRIAATILHTYVKPMPDFFRKSGFVDPDSLCPNPHGEYVEGFTFDAYEGRCLYNSAVNKPVRGLEGLPGIYILLRNMLGDSNIR